MSKETYPHVCVGSDRCADREAGRKSPVVEYVDSLVWADTGIIRISPEAHHANCRQVACFVRFQASLPRFISTLMRRLTFVFPFKVK